VYAAGGSIAWQSKLQTTTAVSRIEAKYMADFGAIEALVWTKGGVERNRFRLCWSDDFSHGQLDCDVTCTKPDTPQEDQIYRHQVPHATRA
jgi:hypothetical protein